MIKTAMIMAAGMGTRFGRYMELVPKGFVEVGGEADIARLRHQTYYPWDGLPQRSV